MNRKGVEKNFILAGVIALAFLFMMGALIDDAYGDTFIPLFDLIPDGYRTASRARTANILGYDLVNHQAVFYNGADFEAFPDQDTELSGKIITPGKTRDEFWNWYYGLYGYSGLRKDTDKVVREGGRTRDDQMEIEKFEYRGNVGGEEFKGGFVQFIWGPEANKYILNYDDSLFYSTGQVYEQDLGLVGGDNVIWDKNDIRGLTSPDSQPTINDKNWLDLRSKGFSLLQNGEGGFALKLQYNGYVQDRNKFSYTYLIYRNGWDTKLRVTMDFDKKLPEEIPLGRLSPFKYSSTGGDLSTGIDVREGSIAGSYDWKNGPPQEFYSISSTEQDRLVSHLKAISGKSFNDLKTGVGNYKLKETASWQAYGISYINYTLHSGGTDTGIRLETRNKTGSIEYESGRVYYEIFFKGINFPAPPSNNRVGVEKIALNSPSKIGTPNIDQSYAIKQISAWRDSILKGGATPKVIRIDYKDFKMGNTDFRMYCVEKAGKNFIYVYLEKPVTSDGECK